LANSWLEVPFEFQYTECMKNKNNVSGSNNQPKNNTTMTYKDLRDQLNKCSEEDLNQTVYLSDEFTEDVFTLEGEGVDVYLDFDKDNRLIGIEVLA